MIQKVQTALNFSKKKNNLKFGEKQVQPQNQTASYVLHKIFFNNND
jgi:hypothetical protein